MYGTGYSPCKKKTFYRQVLNYAQTKRLLKGFEMHYRTSAILNFWQSYGHLKIASLYGEFMKPVCKGKSNTNNLPAPTCTDLTENTNRKKNFFLKRCNSKFGLHGSMWNFNRIETMEADFWKMFSSSRKRGGPDENLSSWVIACPVQYLPAQIDTVCVEKIKHYPLKLYFSMF